MFGFRVLGGYQPRKDGNDVRLDDEIVVAAAYLCPTHLDDPQATPLATMSRRQWGHREGTTRHWPR